MERLGINQTLERPVVIRDKHWRDVCYIDTGETDYDTTTGEAIVLTQTLNSDLLHKHRRDITQSLERLVFTQTLDSNLLHKHRRDITQPLERLVFTQTLDSDLLHKHRRDIAQPQERLVSTQTP